MLDRRRMQCCAPLVLAALSLACSSDDDDDPGFQEATAVAIFGPAADTNLTPYPSNRYTVEDPSTSTGLRVQIDGSNTADTMVVEYPGTITRLNEMDGFSTTGGVVVQFTRPVDPGGVLFVPEADPPLPDPQLDANDFTKPDAPMLMVNVDEGSPDFGEAIGIIPTWWETEQDDFFIADEFTLIAQPAVPLAPATRYAFVLTDRLHAADDDTPIGRSKAMNELLTGTPGGGYESELHAALETVEGLGVERARIVAATVFTTASVLDGVVAMGEARRAAPAPTQGDPWTVEHPASASDARVRLRATYPSPEYRRPKPDGTWQLDDSGTPVVQSTEQLEVFLAFSDSTAGGQRPVVIYGHGLGGDKDGNWGTAERISSIHPNGAAVFSIDSPEHGSRTSGETTLITSVYGFFGIDENNDFDIARARDNFRQMAGDQLELVRFIETLGDLDVLPLDPSGQPMGDGVPDLDTSRILYIGHSFGAVQGPTLFALAPEITAANWNVGGASLMMLLRDSNTFRIVVEGLAPPGTPFGAIARFMAINQAIVDPGDPINFAPYATRRALPGVPGWAPRDVLLQMVVNDTIVPNSTSEAVARAAGLELLNPVKPISGVSVVEGPVTSNLAAGSTAVISEFDVMEGDKIATHGSLIFAPEAQAQYVQFFQSALGQDHATVPPPY